MNFYLADRIGNLFPVILDGSDEVWNMKPSEKVWNETHCERYVQIFHISVENEIISFVMEFQFIKCTEI